jgi:uncharacterized protein (DUF433 family)
VSCGRLLEARIVLVTARNVVADPHVCHGQLTFKGTRILVADVLEQVARGEPWSAIVASWDGKVTTEAIAEAVTLAREALLAGEPIAARG